jgi:hypothetical protein
MGKSLCQRNRHAVAKGPMNNGAEKLNITPKNIFPFVVRSMFTEQNMYQIQLIRTNHLCFILLNVPKVSGKCF